MRWTECWSGSRPEQENEPADQVGYGLLQAEADADAERARKHGERGQVDPDARERDDQRQRDQREAEQLAGENAKRGRQAPGALHPLLEQARGGHREPEKDAERHDSFQDVEHRHAGIREAGRWLFWFRLCCSAVMAQAAVSDGELRPCRRDVLKGSMPKTSAPSATSPRSTIPLAGVGIRLMAKKFAFPTPRAVLHCESA